MKEECEVMKEKWEKTGRQEVGAISVLGHANLGGVSPTLRRACKCAHRTNTVAKKGAATVTSFLIWLEWSRIRVF